jgi:hypothetical protein
VQPSSLLPLWHKKPPGGIMSHCNYLGKFPRFAVKIWESPGLLVFGRVLQGTIWVGGPPAEITGLTQIGYPQVTNRAMEAYGSHAPFSPMIYHSYIPMVRPLDFGGSSHKCPGVLHTGLITIKLSGALHKRL